MLGLRPGALDDGDDPLFDQQVLRGLRLPDLGRAISLDGTDEFDSFVFEVFNHVSRASRGRAPSTRARLRAQRMKRFIEQHAFEDISLINVAACVGLSPFCAIRQFKSTAGSTPLQYLAQLRLDRARNLLSNTRLTIAEIAIRVALYDRRYFSRWFLKHTGLSPQAFREIENR